MILARHPDLAVEVLSPGDRTGEVDEKIDAWLAQVLPSCGSSIQSLKR